MKSKFLRTLVSTVIAFSMVFGIMAIALAEGTPAIVVGIEGTTVTINGSGFEVGQEVGILVLNDGVADVSEIDIDNPIDYIDYIDQVNAEDGSFELEYTTRAVAGKLDKTFKVLTTDDGEGEFVVEALEVDGNKISGTVKALSNHNQIVIKLIDDNGDVAEEINANEDGTFEFEDVAPGTYSVEFKKPSFLKLTITNIVVEEDIALALRTLLAGDYNNDNAINALDLGALLTAWDTITADDKYRPELDFNQDGAINALDLGQLLTNWDKIDVVEEHSN